MIDILTLLKQWQMDESAVQRLIARGAFESEFERSAAWADQPPAEMLQRASGWGALEQLRRAACGEPPLCSQGLVFNEPSLNEEQAPWIALLRDGAMPEIAPQAVPRGLMVQSEWRGLLEKALNSGSMTNWLAWYYLGVMRCHAGDLDGARYAWEESLRQAETVWARRNLAALALQEGRLDEAAELYLAACRQRPSLLPLVVECGRALIEAGRPRQWLDFLSSLPDSIRSMGRVRLLEGQAALAVGDLPLTARILEERPVVVDLREGEVSLSHLWFAYHERRLSLENGLPIDDALRARVRREHPLPKELDFRTTVDEPL